MTTIKSFVNRLAKIGIKVELIGNYPWVYLDTVCGNKVNATLQADHGFTVFMQGIKLGEPDRITNITIIFKEIKKHI
jgi:hypothetical protein